jgi:ribosomal protein L37AE/L43A
MPIYRITIEKVERHVFDVLAPDGMEAQRDVLDCTRNYESLRKHTVLKRWQCTGCEPVEPDAAWKKQVELGMFKESIS